MGESCQKSIAPEMGTCPLRIGANQNHSTYNEATLQEMNICFLHPDYNLNLRANLFACNSSTFRKRKDKAELVECDRELPLSQGAHQRTTPS
jgi:hypothetical protein